MQKQLMLLFAISFSCTLLSAQEIVMKTPILTYKFEQDGKRLSWKDLLNATKDHEESYHLIHKARTNNTVAAILSVAGGAMIGIPIGQAISHKEANWNLAYVGTGIWAVSIPFTIGTLKNAKKGVDTYNLSLKSTKYQHYNPEFKLRVSGTHLGLSMIF